MDAEVIVCPKCGTARPAGIKQCSICPSEPAWRAPGYNSRSRNRWLVVFLVSMIATMVVYYVAEDVDASTIAALPLAILAAFSFAMLVRKRKK